MIKMNILFAKYTLRQRLGRGKFLPYLSLESSKTLTIIDQYQ